MNLQTHPAFSSPQEARLASSGPRTAPTADRASRAKPGPSTRILVGTQYRASTLGQYPVPNFRGLRTSSGQLTYAVTVTLPGLLFYFRTPSVPVRTGSKQNLAIHFANLGSFRTKKQS